MLCVFSFSPAPAFRLKAEFRPFVERTATGETSIRQNWQHRKHLREIRNLFGNATASAGTAFGTRNRMQRTKQSRDWPQHADEFLLVTQNVDDLHARAGLRKEKMVQIHGDIFLTRCSRCDFGFIERKHDHEQEQEQEDRENAVFGVRGHVRAFKAATCRRIPKCSECDAIMRPGVVWFGEQLPWNELQRVESYLDRGACSVVIVAGTTATFGYIVDWALRVSGGGGELIEVNPEETPLSRFATRLVREPAAIALPRIVDQIIRL
jgi:NAD-dependent SIR2 family protein deacetylase